MYIELHQILIGVKFDGDLYIDVETESENWNGRIGKHPMQSLLSCDKNN